MPEISFHSQEPFSSLEVQAFKNKLNILSNSGILAGYLIVKEKEGLCQTHLFRVIWEKFKGLLGFSDRTNHRFLQFKICQFLWERRSLVKTDEQVRQIRALAKQVGIEPFNSRKDDPLHMRELVDGICQGVFQKEKVPYDFFKNFFKYYRKELTSFSEEIEKVLHVFHQVIGSPELEKERDLVEEDRENAQNKNPGAADQESAPFSSNQKDDQSQKEREAVTGTSALTGDSATNSDFVEGTAPAEDLQAGVVQKVYRKFQVLTKKELTSAQWRTAGVLAVCGVGTIALGVIGYLWWQSHGSIMPEREGNPLWNLPEYGDPQQTLCEISTIFNPFTPQSLANLAYATKELIVQNYALNSDADPSHVSIGPNGLSTVEKIVGVAGSLLLALGMHVGRKARIEVRQYEQEARLEREDAEAKQRQIKEERHAQFHEKIQFQNEKIEQQKEIEKKVKIALSDLKSQINLQEFPAGNSSLPYSEFFEVRRRLSDILDLEDIERIESSLNKFDWRGKAPVLFALTHLDFASLDTKGLDKQSIVTLPFLVQQLSILLKDEKLTLDSIK